MTIVGYLYLILVLVVWSFLFVISICFILPCQPFLFGCSLHLRLGFYRFVIRFLAVLSLIWSSRPHLCAQSCTQTFS